MKYKALFLDIDDTLIGNDKQISSGNLAAIRRAQDAGIFVTIATGRGYKGASSIWKKLDIQGPVIVYGGACIMNTITDESMFMGSIDPKLIREVLNCSKEWGLHAQLYQGDTVIFEKESEFSVRYTSFLNLPFQVDPMIREKDWYNVPKVLVYAEPGEQEAEMIKRYSSRFADRMEVASSKPGYIELNRFGANKGTAVLHTADLMGILPAETVAVGDNTLDYQMIQMAGLGVCVGNGQQAIKDIADVIAPACEEDGVAWVIDHIMLAE